MFERFTDRARRVIVLAQQEARMLSHNYIGTEHLLLGLIAEADGVGAQIVARLGASRRAVHDKVIELIGSEPDPAAAEIGPRPRGARVRGVALSEVRDLLASIDRRLSAIERHLGIAAAPDEPEDSRAVPDEPEDPQATAADEPEDPQAGAADEPEDPQAAAE